MAFSVGLLAACFLTAGTLASAAVPSRRVLWWMEPYGNLTSTAAYVDAWSQWGSAANHRAGYWMAGSAYAAKTNGSLGYADTSAGEGTNGALMEMYGWAAMHELNVTALALVYITHNAAITKILSSPQSFIDQLLAKATAFPTLAGFDFDYEPQTELSDLEAVAFMDFLASAATQLAARGLVLTIDVGGCPAFHSFLCSGAAAIPNLLQVNTMDSFGVSSVSAFASYVSQNNGTLKGQWAPGFGPAGSGQAAIHAIWSYLPGAGINALATWEVHESNVGPQPQWLFDAANAFLDAA